MVAAMIVASGRTSFPGEFLPYKKIGNISAVQRMVLMLQRAGVDRVFLVTSEDARQLEKHLSRMDTVSLFNDHPDAEMIDNIKFALREMPKKFSRALIAPVDTPLFSDETLRALLQSKARAAIPVFHGRSGHPVMVTKELFDEILRSKGEGGLRAFFEGMTGAAEKIPVEDEGILRSVRRDDEDWDALAKEHSLARLHPLIRVSLARDEVFFGPGVATLMELTDETESIRAACEKMGISYSKGWLMIQHFEERAGFLVMERQQGGKTGGISLLTPEGRAFLENYRRYAALVKEEAERLFGDYF